MIVFSSISEHVDCVVVVVFIFYFLIFRILEAINSMYFVCACVFVFWVGGCLRTAFALGITLLP